MAFAVQLNSVDVFQALASVDIGSLICNVGAGGGAPAPAAAGAGPAAGEAPGKCFEEYLSESG